jgi:heme exporter protein CcmD|tara:strand:+ start:193 stop:426 length:234 start_codon:yes stop_codon:yes gene_type:complete
MILKFISMNGYGLFVWLSFGITLLTCSLFYLKTKKTLKKYEKEFFNELKNLSEDEKREVLKKSKIAGTIYATVNKAN